MNKEKLIEILHKYVECDEKNAIYESINVPNITYEKVKQSLLGYGLIEVDNKLEQYVLFIPKNNISAFSKACMIIAVNNGHLDIISYAKEGLIKQNIAKKNLDSVILMVNNKPVSKQININMIAILIVAMVISLTLISYVKSVSNNTNINTNTEITNSNNQDHYIDEDVRIALIDQYNNAVTNLNNIADSYNSIVTTLSISNIEELPEKLDTYDFLSADCDLTNEQLSEKVNEFIAIIDNEILNLAIIDKLNNLDEKDVHTALSSVNNISNFQSITSNNDPNGLLEKEHGYISCTYFELDLVSAKDVPGQNVIEKGTDGGGCIELYATLEDAEDRCEYLSQFDDTLLYSGSYALVGRAVIRTSYLLTNQQQITITKQIVKELISPTQVKKALK